jgi:lipoprotein NlpD
MAAVPPPARRERLRSLPRVEEPQGGNDGLFSWPLEGTVTSGFGPRNGSFHDGIDIAAPIGTPILAVADGQVIFSDQLRGYGNVVIVRHGAQYITVYAHTRTNLVKEGQVVRRGQRIAEVGQTGRTTGPSLHFEVRKNNLAQDPLRYLPQDRRTVQESH